MSDAEKGIRTPVALKADTSSEAALANTTANETVAIAPNPFTGSFVVTINAKKDGKAQVSIYNSVGGKSKRPTGRKSYKRHQQTIFQWVNLCIRHLYA
jgi:hypothetical protein